jgi:hypothetical protein
VDSQTTDLSNVYVMRLGDVAFCKSVSILCKGVAFGQCMSVLDKNVGYG